jgi:hypothetical protein
MKNIISFLISILFSPLSFCQPFESSQYAVTIPAAFAVGSFKDAVSNDGIAFGYGLGFNFLQNSKGKKASSSFFYGFDFNYLTYGRDKHEGSGSNPDLKTTFNYYGISGIARMYLMDKPKGLIPFIDAQIGCNIINASTKIDKDLMDILVGEDEPEYIDDFYDTGLLYGAGFGLYTRTLKTNYKSTGSTLSFKISYLSGNNVTHFKRGSLQYMDGYASYETTTTRVNNIVIQLGLVVPIIQKADTLEDY